MNLGQNVNLNFQNDADDDGGGGGGDAGTSHPSWQVFREHHAQGPNIPFRESLTLIYMVCVYIIYNMCV